MLVNISRNSRRLSRRSYASVAKSKGTAKEDEKSSTKKQHDKVATAETPTVEAAKGGSPCNDYFYHGGCTRGAKCRFSHDGLQHPKPEIARIRDQAKVSTVSVSAAGISPEMQTFKSDFLKEVQVLLAGQSQLQPPKSANAHVTPSFHSLMLQQQFEYERDEHES